MRPMRMAMVEAVTAGARWGGRGSAMDASPAAGGGLGRRGLTTDAGPTTGGEPGRRGSMTDPGRSASCVARPMGVRRRRRRTGSGQCSTLLFPYTTLFRSSPDELRWRFRLAAVEVVGDAAD